MTINNSGRREESPAWREKTKFQANETLCQTKGRRQTLKCALSYRHIHDMHMQHTHTCVHIHRAMIDLFSHSLMDKTLTASLANLLHHVACVIIFIKKSWVWELLKINSREFSDSEIINLCDWGQKVSLPYVINSLASLPNSYLQHQPPHKER